MLSISVDAPASITKEVLESGNKYGRDVLLGNLGSNLDLPNSISASERNAIFDMVNGAKPELGGGIHELGFSDVFRYEDWLKSLKTYAPDEAIFHKTLENLIQTRMADPRDRKSTRLNSSHLVISYAVFCLKKKKKKRVKNSMRITNN